MLIEDTVVHLCFRAVLAELEKGLAAAAFLQAFDMGCTVGQITIFLDINRIRHKMVKNAIKVGNLRRKTSLGPNFFV